MAAPAGGAGAFIRRYPWLFHVTDPAALPGIETDRPLPAQALLRLCEVPEHEAIFGLNRGKGNFRVLEHTGHPGAVAGKSDATAGSDLFVCTSGMLDIPSEIPDELPGGMGFPFGQGFVFLLFLFIAKPWAEAPV